MLRPRLTHCCAPSIARYERMLAAPQSRSAGRGQHMQQAVRRAVLGEARVLPRPSFPLGHLCYADDADCRQ
jgi:hypothetical protein